MKKQIFLILFLILISAEIKAQATAWNFLNYECGGYALEIIPVVYPSGQQPSSINSQVLYARTDVGGIYRSHDNGTSWDYDACYYRINGTTNQSEISPSEMSVQGLTVRQNDINSNNTQTVVACWGNDPNDAFNSIVNSNRYQSIWRSSNNGNTWTWTQSAIDAPGVWWNTNDNVHWQKVGGECIIYDPNNIDYTHSPSLNNSYMYMGGFPPPGSQCKLYKSTDDGRTWHNNLVPNFPGQIDEGINCIAMHPGSNHIWVGTTNGIVYSTDNGSSWTRISNSPTWIKKIILKSTGSNTIAFLTYGTDGSNSGVGKCINSGGTWIWQDRSSNFFTNGIGRGSASFSAIAFVDDAESVIIAGQFQRPFRKTTTDMETWLGEGGNSDVSFTYDANNNKPAHRFSTENGGNPIYDGLSYLNKNPNTGWGSQWYMAGGAGLRMTVTGVSGNSFQNATWKYTDIGQSMTVVSDIVFNNNLNAVFMPMSDWTMGWAYYNEVSPNPPSWLISSPLDYDRIEVRDNCIQDSWISNVTRMLQDPDNSSISYCVGGSLNSGCSQDYLAGFYKRTQVSGHGATTIERKGYTTTGFLQASTRGIVDAVLLGTGNTKKVIALVGITNQLSSPNPSQNTGIYYTTSTDLGQNWSSATFDQPTDNSISTQDAYNSSLISALSGSIGDLFNGHFNLCSIGGNKVLLWLEVGGLFLSNDGGASWAGINSPTLSYFGTGSLKYIGVDGSNNPMIALAVRSGSGAQNGLFKGTLIGNIVTWSTIPGFISAEHVDIVNGKWAVNGMRTNDKQNQIYKSLDNGSSWSRIPLYNGGTAPLPLFPVVNSLRIRPGTNDLWIATGGQGTWIYKMFAPADSPDPWIISQNTTVDYVMFNDRDIIVENNAQLTLQGTPDNHLEFDMGVGRRITVQQGSSLNANYVDFNCPQELGGNWVGIELTGATNSSINNCTFSNATLSLNIYNPSYVNSGMIKIIHGNTFHVPAGPSSPYAVYAGNVTNVLADFNTFDLSANSSAIGFSIENGGSTGSGAGGSGGGDYPVPALTITDNSFTGGTLHLSLNCLLASTANFSIRNNTFSGSTNGNGTGFFASNITGNFRKNTFYSSAYSTPFQIIQSNLNIFQNTILGTTGSTVDLESNSTANIQPTLNDQGQYIWYGGQNTIQMLNAGTSGYNDIYFTQGCSLLGDKGQNCFTLNTLTNNNNITGTLSRPCSRSYYLTQNSWNATPQFNLTCGGASQTVTYLPTISCPQPNDISSITSSYIVIDEGNGIKDSINVTSPPGGGSQSSSGNEDGILYSHIIQKKIQKDYAGAINDCKTLIDSYDSSKYFFPALDELFISYKKSDTTGNQNTSNVLFNQLKTYLEQKMQQYPDLQGFVAKAYNNYLMCLVKLTSYSEAIGGYENIMNNNPDPVSRLTASWNRSEAILLMNGHGGSELGDGIDLNNEEKLMNYLNDKSPAHKIAMDMFVQMSKEDNITEALNDSKDNSKGTTKNTSVNSTQKYDKIKLAALNSRISKFNPNDRKELDIKIKGDIIALLGLTRGSGKSNNIIPTVFSLAQNYPNPFNPSTIIRYALPNDVKVVIKIYDILGREVKILVNDVKKAGYYETTFDGSNIASGVYFYHIEAGTFIQSKKMVLIK